MEEAVLEMEIISRWDILKREILFVLWFRYYLFRHLDTVTRYSYISKCARFRFLPPPLIPIPAKKK